MTVMVSLQFRQQRRANIQHGRHRASDSVDRAVNFNGTDKLVG
jgi:hypothetical protein